MTAPITVAIPVGPKPANKRWLPDCLKSIADQTVQPAEVLIIDDMAGVSGALYETPHGTFSFSAMLAAVGMSPLNVRIWHSPWLLAVAHAFNFGVALAQEQLVLLMGSDDYLEPDAIEACVAEYNRTGPAIRNLAYYFLGVHYLDGREDDIQTLPCNAAMVTKTLWRANGGFPYQAAHGAPDAALISIMLIHPEAGAMIPVDGARPLYHYRPHPDTDTSGLGPWQGVILATRDLVTEHWRRPEWGRFE